MHLSANMLTGLWLIGVAAAWTGILVHDRTPGETIVAGHKWPLKTSLHRMVNGPTLVMFAHPRCPCTGASLDQLEQIVARKRDGKLQTYVVFFTPDATADGAWLKSDNMARASRIKGVTVITDPGGVEANVFGAITSGDLKVYDGNGDLRYSGGITPERGHPGDNNGQRTVTAMLQGVNSTAPPAGVLRGPVFGCRILPEQTANP